VSEAKKVLELAIERWNATDRDGWAALYTDDVVHEAPGGARISGLGDLKEKWRSRCRAGEVYRDAYRYLAQSGRC
jgi:hypothetical protein